MLLVFFALFFILSVTSFCLVVRILLKKIEVEKKMSYKHLQLYLLMVDWLKLRQSGNDIAKYLEERGYKNIAIYGMSYAGECLVEELEDSHIQVSYAIDKNADNIFSHIDVLKPDNSLGNVDAVIVTTITAFDGIKELLTEKLSCPVLSLKNILLEMDTGNGK